MTEIDLSASLEDYLEAIFHIARAKGAARPKDIAARLGVNNSSVTGALRALAARELINYAPYDVVTLTAGGEVVAEDVVRRHEALRNFFVKVLSVDEDLAEDAACKMEHAVPREIVERLVQFADFVEVCPRGGSQFIEGFGYHCNNGCDLDGCDRCLADALDGVQDRRADLEVGRRGPHSLDRLPCGVRARVVEVRGAEPLAGNLVERGFAPGAVVEVERSSRRGDALQVTVSGRHLAIHPADAEQVLVEALEPL